MHKIISDLSFRNGPSTGHCCSLNMKCLPQTDALRVLTSPVDYIIDTFITEWATRIWDSEKLVTGEVTVMALSWPQSLFCFSCLCLSVCLSVSLTLPCLPWFVAARLNRFAIPP